MERAIVELVTVGQLHDPTEVQHGDSMGDVAHHGEVVRDEKERHAQLLLETAQEIHDLGLDAHIKRAHRLIADH
jgi:hypothetical protein